jgi:hypothetical protein
MSDTTTAASEKIMDRVAALLAVAEHPNTPPAEAETALMMANSLITKHAIDEAILRQSQSINDRRAIKTARIVLGYGEFTPYLRTVFEAAAEALRVSVGSKHVWSDGHSTTEFWAYGADEDVAWLDMLFNMIKLQFLLKLDPKWDESLGYDANIYNFKVAGFKWAEIDRTAQRNGHESRESTELCKRHVYNYDKGVYEVIASREPNGFFHKLKAAYIRHAKKIGDEERVVTQSHEAYRLSFAESFRSTMVERFWQMQRDAEREMDTIPGAALAIRDMKQEADEALWADFPEMSPEEIERRRQAWLDQQEAERKVREEMLAAMTTKARQQFLENEEAAKRRQAKRDRAWTKKNTRTFYYDNSALARGAAAANSVDLSRKAGAADGAAKRGELN